MKDILINLISDTTFLTIISGVLVYIFSQYYLEFVINPSKEYRKLKRKIIYLLTMYSCYYTNPYDLLHESRNIRDKKEYDEARAIFRETASELAGYIGMLSWIRMIRRKKLKQVINELIGLSNSFYIVSEEYDTIKANKESEQIIKKAFKVK